MKKVMFLSLGLFLLATSAYAAVAPDRVQRFDVGLSAAGAFNDNSDDTGLYSTTISYGVTEWVAIGMEAGWQEASAASDEDLGVVPILADIIVRVPNRVLNIHESIVPYGVVGLGVIGAYVTDEDGEAATNNGDDVDDTSFAWKIGGGFDWFFQSNWALNFEVAYYDSDPDLVTSSLASDGVSFLTVGGGIKYVF